VSRRPNPRARSISVATGLALAVAASGSTGRQDRGLEGSWRAFLELAGGKLPFALSIRGSTGTICNGPSCTEITRVIQQGDSVVLDLADYAATISLRRRGDSLAGMYRNVGNRGPRAIPMRASRGTWSSGPGPASLLGRWDATFIADQRPSPRVFEFRNGPAGFEASFEANSGDYGLFTGIANADSFRVSHFDGAFVYLLEGRILGDTLKGVFHAGVRTQTPYFAVRSTGKPHLVAPTELTRADTTRRFEFSFPDLEGRVVTQDDPRFTGKVVVIDVFGSWCPTCHDAAPALVDLYRRYHDRGLEVVGFAYEVSDDSTEANPLIRRFRDKFSIPYPLLRAGTNVVEATAATLPQLIGFTAYPTTIFLGRDGRAKVVYAGFRGPATGALHRKQVEDYDRIVRELLAR
jgi:thiol-disulfide isomerase/thioredoxin